MTYEAWRISYQSSEQAARAAYAECDELRSKVETTENDAAHQKALADSALRVAEGWERKCGELRAALRHETDCVEAAKAEIDALRSKIEAMERQKPVGKFAQHPSNGLWEQDGYGDNPEARPLYALPGAQAHPASSEQDESVRKSWVRFSNELHRSPDAPYPGMSEAFEQHFSQSFTDRDWRVESGIWAAAWKAAKHHGAQGE